MFSPVPERISYFRLTCSHVSHFLLIFQSDSFSPFATFTAQVTGSLEILRGRL